MKSCSFKFEVINSKTYSLVFCHLNAYLLSALTCARHYITH